MIPGSKMRRVAAMAVFLASVAACAIDPAPSAHDSPRQAAAAQAQAAASMQSPLGNYLAARHAQVGHDYADAALMMERALKNDPDNFDLVRRTFALRVSEGHVDAAVPLARRIIAVDGNSGLAALVLVVADIKSGNYAAAAQRIQALPGQGPQRFALPLLAAWVEAGRHHPDEAMQALQQMSAQPGLEPLRELHVGLIADYLGRTDMAEEAFAKLLAEEPRPTWRVVEVVGNFDERHGKSDAARKLYERFAVADPDTDAAAPGLARIAAGTVPPQLIATPNAGAAEALFDLGSLLDQRDTIDAALIYVRLALALEPNFPLAQLLAGEIREDEGQTADALALYRAVDRQAPLGWSARLRAAFTLDALTRTDEAISDLRAMASERPTQAEPLIELGDILRSQNRFDEAALAYDAAIARLPKIDKSTWRLFYDRGVALERAGQWPRAEADLKHAYALDPDQPTVLNYLGYSWIDKGENLPEALKMITRAVELRPNDGYIVDSLGWAFYRLGDLSHATEYLERAIELLPEDPTINDHLGDVYWRTGRLAEARFQWRRALQFGPEAGDAKTIETKLDHGLAKPPQTMSGG
jgi:tetratricopeptide (TPR) repeat protein